jgi:redox-sensing transcriptional repressor
MYRKGCVDMQTKEISKAVLRRLPGYLAYLKNIPDTASPYISATAVAAALSMGEVQVRKDLAAVSDGGRPKLGYLRKDLIEDISRFLGYDNTTDAILVGAGKLGRALLGYSGFEEYGLTDIYWCVAPDNARALRFYDKNVFPRVPIDAIKNMEGYTKEQIDDYVWYQVSDKSHRTNN